MGFIPCLSNCKYQKDGVCTLESTVSNSIIYDSGCIHYVPKSAFKYDKKEIKIIRTQTPDH